MFIVKLGDGMWRSRCCFGVTSYEDRAARFDTARGAKISLSRLRKGSALSYPDAEVVELIS
jgi:hypothetical protein